MERILKTEFLERVRTTHLDLEILLEKHLQHLLDRSEPGVKESVRDFLYHISWYEAEMVNLLTHKDLHGSDWWDLPLDDRNALIQATCRQTSLQQVIDQEKETFRSMVILLESMEEISLNDPAAFKGMPDEWQPWSVIASNSCDHYLEHLDQLQTILLLPK